MVKNNLEGGGRDKVQLILWALVILNCLLILCVALGKSICPVNLIGYLNQIDGDGQKNGVTFVHMVTSLGALVGLLLFQLRNKAMTAQTKSQYKIFNEDKQFSNFLDATKLLTDKDSTTEAKIAAMFSLADVAKAHPEHLDRIIQVINSELTLLIKFFNKKESNEKYERTLKKIKTVSGLSGKKTTKVSSFINNKQLNIDSLKKNSRKCIKDWQYNGNGAEKTISVALYVIRKIILELELSDSQFDFSNTIFFDIDVAFGKKSLKGKFIREDDKLIENAIFLDCKLKEVDFSETNLHFCKFINCDLSGANFNDANLWGALFNNCNLNGTKYEESVLEGVYFEKCKNFTTNQLGNIRVDNNKTTEISNVLEAKKYLKEERRGLGGKNESKYNDLKYLITIDANTIKNINCKESDASKRLYQDNFITSEDYQKWKDSDKN